MIEKSIHLLTVSMTKSDMKEGKKHIYFRQQNYDNSSSIRKQVSEIPLSFESHLKARHMKMFDVVTDQQSKVSPVLHQAREITNENSLGTEGLQNDHPSMRCIIIHSFREDAVCRE